MIRGRVNANIEPIVTIELRKVTGEFDSFDIKFDTGFNGELGLPESVLKHLEKSPVDAKLVRFANDDHAIVDAYDVEARIDGEIRHLTAMDFGSGSRLLGMRALPQWTGCVEFRFNGDVRIENRS